MRELSIVLPADRRLLRSDGLQRWFLIEPARASHGAGPQGLALEPDRWLAKQLAPGMAADRKLLESWLQVAADNAELQHPACARIEDFGVRDDSAFIVSHYPAGRSLLELAQAIRFAGPGASELVGQVGVLILDGLEHARVHKPHLTHLDLDLDSVRVRADGSLVLPELGLWSVLSPADISRARFDSGRVQFCAPELVESRATDFRSDLFSLGVLLFRLITGELPFVGATQLVIAMAIADGKRSSVRDKAPEASDDLCQIIEALLATDPGQRFQSFAAARTALSSTIHASSEELCAQLGGMNRVSVAPLAHGGRNKAAATMMMVSPFAGAAAQPSPSLRGPDAVTHAVLPARGPAARTHASPTRAPEPVTQAPGSTHAQASLARGPASAPLHVDAPSFKGVPMAARATGPMPSSHAAQSEPAPPPLFMPGQERSAPVPAPPERPSPKSERRPAMSSSPPKHVESPPFVHQAWRDDELAVNDGRTQHLRAAASDLSLPPRDGTGQLPSQPPLHASADALAQPRDACHDRSDALSSVHGVRLPLRSLPPASSAPALASARAPGPPQARVDSWSPAPQSEQRADAWSVPSPERAARAAREVKGQAWDDAWSAPPQSAARADAWSAPEQPPARAESRPYSGRASTPGKADKWRDPSDTVFQMKSVHPGEAALSGKKKISIPSLLLVSMILGFTAVVGLYFLYRLL